MQTIQPIQIEDAGGSTRRLLENVSSERADISTMVKTMAQSPRTLEGYLQFSRALNGGKLSAKTRELIALTVAQANDCEYSLAQHAWQAAQLGLTNDEILASREARAADRKAGAALKFARDLVIRSAECSTVGLRDAEYTDSEIVEIVAQAALNVFENYFNLVVRTDLDFPKVAPRVRAA